MSSDTQRHRRKEARPGEIIAAALTIFHTKGYAASKIEDVATAAGVTKGTVYLYFSSKEALFKAAIIESILPNLDRIEEAVKTETTAHAQLRIAMQLWAETISASRGSLFKLMLAEAGNFPELAEYFLENVSGRVRRMLASIVEFGIENGEFRACNPDVVVRVLTAPILLGDVWRRTFPNLNAPLPEPGQLIESLLDVVLNGINPRMEIYQ